LDGCTLLEEAIAKGGKIEWRDSPSLPRLFVPQGMGVKLQEDLPTVREVLRRAADFRGQLHTPGPAPLLRLTEHTGDEGCLSCGEPIERSRFRCPICVLAVALALET